MILHSVCLATAERALSAFDLSPTITTFPQRVHSVCKATAERVPSAFDLSPTMT